MAPTQEAAAAISLLRHARVGTLATLDRGRPFAALVTPATDADRSPLLLLSALSPHTRQLRANPACALLIAGVAPEANPQTAPRLSLGCRATQLAPQEAPSRRRRYLAHHPYAALYADFGDFAFWRLEIEAANLVRGFAAAGPLEPAQLQPDKTRAAALAAAEAALLREANEHDQPLLGRIAAAHGGGRDRGGAWRLAALDLDGFWLTQDDQSLRIDLDLTRSTGNRIDFAALRRDLNAISGDSGG